LTPIEKDWIFVSDAHFTGTDSKEMESFVRFLNSEGKRMGHLVILGDLFEFLFGFKDPSPGGHVPRREAFPFPDYLPVLESMEGLFRQGIRIKYFEGNHDFFLQRFFSEQLKMGVEVHPEECEITLAGKRAFVAHGDLSNPRQRRYRAFRKILKNRWTYGLIELAGPNLVRRVARALSRRSYQKYHAGGGSVPPPAFKAFSHRKFLEGFEIVILGHSHFPERVEEWVDGRRCLYFNAGDWMSRRSFLRFTPPESFQLCRYEE
jgi:UDP-2,3-diacylglucosamine hydrolase